MKIGFIGAGRVGFSVGKYLKLSGICVTGYFSKTKIHADEAARFTDTCSFQNLEDIIKASDTLFIATPDSQIKAVWDCIAQYPIKNKILCHFSGSVSSAVFSDIHAHGAYGCSLHPMLAFSDKYSSYSLLNGTFCTLEGDEAAVSVLSELLLSLKNPYRIIRSCDKVKYHAAASVASNGVVALIQLGTELLCSCGFSEQEAYEALQDLAINNVKAVFEMKAEKALTGPVERCDTDTVQKHLQALDDEDRQLYSLLAVRLVKIARNKHPDSDYTSVLHLLDTFREK